MKRCIKRFLVIAFFIGMTMNLIGCEQTSISKKDIPTNVRADVKEQIERLYSWDPVKRRNAAIALGEIGEEAAAAIPFLVSILGDATIVGRPIGELASEALAKIGKQAVEPLLTALKHKDDITRRNAASALGKIGDSRVVEPLIGALNDKHEYVRVVAASALGEIRDRRAIEPLVALMKDESPWVRWNAESALESIDSDWPKNDASRQAVPELIAALKHNDRDVRESAVETLGEIADPQAVDALVSALKDKESDVRQSAVYALGRIGDPRAVGPLAAVLTDSNENIKVRARAARALGEIDPNWANTNEIGKQVLPELISALNHKDWFVRADAAEALGKIGSPDAVEPLLATLKDLKDENEWLEARIAETVRAEAAEALGRIKDSRAVEPLFAALKDASWDVRSKAAEALGKIKDSRAVEPLIAALKDSAVNVREEAALALGEIGDRRAVGHLIATLDDKNAYVRRDAAAALGKIRDIAAVEPLIGALADEDQRVREAAAKALERIAGRKFGEDPKKWQKWWRQKK